MPGNDVFKVVRNVTGELFSATIPHKYSYKSRLFPELIRWTEDNKFCIRYRIDEEVSGPIPRAWIYAFAEYEQALNWIMQRGNTSIRFEIFRATATDLFYPVNECSSLEQNNLLLWYIGKFDGKRSVPPGTVMCKTIIIKERVWSWRNNDTRQSSGNGNQRRWELEHNR